MMAVEIVTRPTLRPGKLRLLFERAFAKGGRRPRYDALATDAGFDAESTMDDVPDHRLNVVLNWTEELQVRVPVK